MRFLSVSAKAFWAFAGVVVLALMVVAFVVPTLFSRQRSRAGEFQAMKGRFDSHTVQAWAKLILREHTNAATLCPYFDGITPDPKMLILSNPPAFLSGMAMFGRMGPMGVSVSALGPASNRCVTLLYVESYGFGGDGHLIEAGDESYRAATNADCIEWIPGVYYRRVHSP